MDLANLEIRNIFFNEEKEENEEIQICSPKWYIHNKENPFEFFNKQEFKKRFWFSGF